MDSPGGDVYFHSPTSLPMMSKTLRNLKASMFPLDVAGSDPVALALAAWAVPPPFSARSGPQYRFRSLLEIPREPGARQLLPPTSSRLPG